MITFNAVENNAKSLTQTTITTITITGTFVILPQVFLRANNEAYLPLVHL